MVWQGQRDWRDWYNDAGYHKRRAQQLRHQPLCERCLAEGKVEPATIAHHIERHRGDIIAFRSGTLWSLCKRCDGLTESGKPRQKRVIGPDGFPIG